MSKFQICYYTNYLCDGVMDFCDTPPEHNDCNSNNCGPPDKPYICCWPCITPITMVYDLISCPYRGILYTIRKKKKVNLRLEHSMVSI